MPSERGADRYAHDHASPALEQEYNKLVGKLVDHKADDLAPPNELGGGRRASANGSAAAVAVNKAPPVGGGGGKKKGFKLEEVTRWTMVCVAPPSFALASPDRD